MNTQSTPALAPSKKSFLRRMFRFAFIAILLLVVLGGAVYFFFGDRIIKGIVCDKLGQAVGEPVNVSEFSFSLFSGVKAGGVTIGDSGAFKIGRLVLDVDGGGLFGKRLDITKLNLADVEINETLRPDGSSNLDKLITFMVEPSSFDWPMTAVQPELSFSKISLRNGAFTLDNFSVKCFKTIDLRKPDFTLALFANKVTFNGQAIDNFESNLVLNNSEIRIEKGRMNWMSEPLFLAGKALLEDAMSGEISLKGINLNAQATAAMGNGVECNLDISGDPKRLLEILDKMKIAIPPVCAELTRLNAALKMPNLNFNPTDFQADGIITAWDKSQRQLLSGKLSCRATPKLDAQVSLTGNPDAILTLLKGLKIDIPPAFAEVTGLDIRATGTMAANITESDLAGNFVIQARNNRPLLESTFSLKDSVFSLLSFKTDYKGRAFEGQGAYKIAQDSAELNLLEKSSNSRLECSVQNVTADPDISLTADLHNITDEVLQMLPQYQEISANFRLLEAAEAKAKIFYPVKPNAEKKLSLTADCSLPAVNLVGNKATELKLKIATTPENIEGSEKLISIIDIKGQVCGGSLAGKARIDASSPNYFTTVSLETTAPFAIEKFRGAPGEMFKDIQGELAFNGTVAVPLLAADMTTELDGKAEIVLKNVAFRGEKMEKVEFQMTAKEGLYTLSEIKGRIFGGDLKAAAAINLKTNKFSGSLSARNSAIFEVLGRQFKDVPTVIGNSVVSVSKFEGTSFVFPDLLKDLVVEGEITADRVDYQGMTCQSVKTPLSYSNGRLLLKDMTGSVTGVDKTFVDRWFFNPRGAYRVNADISLGKIPTSADGVTMDAMVQELIAGLSASAQATVAKVAAYGFNFSNIALTLETGETKGIKQLVMSLKGGLLEGEFTGKATLDTDSAELPAAFNLETTELNIERLDVVLPEQLNGLRGRLKAKLSGSVPLRKSIAKPDEVSRLAQCSGELTAVTLKFKNETADNVVFRFGLKDGLFKLEDMRGKILGGDVEMSAEANLNTMNYSGKLSARSTRLFEVVSPLFGGPLIKGKSDVVVREFSARGLTTKEIMESLKIDCEAAVERFEYQGVAVNNLRLPLKYETNALKISGAKGFIAEMKNEYLKQQWIIPTGNIDLNADLRYERIPDAGDFATMEAVSRWLSGADGDVNAKISNLEMLGVNATDFNLKTKFEKRNQQSFLIGGVSFAGLGGNLNIKTETNAGPRLETSFDVLVDNISVEQYKGPWMDRLEGYKGRISLKAAGSAPFGEAKIPLEQTVALDGNLVVHTLTTPYGPSENDTVKFSVKNGIMHVEQNGKICGGQMDALADIDLKNFTYTGKVKSTGVPLLEIVGKFVPDMPPIKGPVDVNITEFSASGETFEKMLTKLKLKGEATSPKLNYNGLVFETLSIPVQCDNGKLVVNNLSANTSGGTLNANLTVINLGPDQTFEGDYTLKTMSISSLVQPFARIHDVLSGTVETESKNTFKGSGMTWEKISASLTCDNVVFIKEGKVDLIKDKQLKELCSITQALAVPLAILPQKVTNIRGLFPGEVFTFAQNQRHSFRVANGKTNIKKTLFVGARDLDFSLEGNIGLDQKLDLIINFIPKSSYQPASDLDKKIMSIVTTTPLQIGGTLSSPDYKTSEFRDRIIKSIFNMKGKSLPVNPQDIFDIFAPKQSGAGTGGGQDTGSKPTIPNAGSEEAGTTGGTIEKRQAK